MDNAGNGAAPQQTMGQRLVGLSFNPSGDDRVAQTKQKFADIIDELGSLDVDSLGREVVRSAIDNVVTAQMHAVKALTWKK